LTIHFVQGKGLIKGKGMNVMDSPENKNLLSLEDILKIYGLAAKG